MNIDAAEKCCKNKATKIDDDDDDEDDVLLNCTFITDHNDKYRINSRFIECRCPYLIPHMKFDEGAEHYIIKTPVDIKIIKAIFYILKYGSTDVEDWLQLERIIQVANQWKLVKVPQCIIQRFISRINEENCISVWRMSIKYSPSDAKKVFEYVLYTVNESVKKRYNIDFFRLRSHDLFQILDADLLKIDSEIDVWNLLKKWILADRKERFAACRYLLKSIRYNLLNDAEKAQIKNDLNRMRITTGNKKSISWSTINEYRSQRDFILAFGGWEKTGPSNAAEVLDIFKNQWRSALTIQDKRKVAYHENIVIANKLYVIGGFDGTQYFNTVRCYDSNTREWMELAPMHHARCYIAACEIRGTIIVAGGSDGRTRLKTAEMYDAKKNQWTKIRNMLQRRSDAAACAMGGKMYIAGGFTGETVLQTVEVYTPETDIWVEVAHMSTPRSGLACVASTDFMLIAGGFDGINRLSTAEILRIGSAHTVIVQSMPIPRSNFAMCKMGNYFYAVGGYSTSVTKSVLRFDGKKWERVADISSGRSALKVVILKAWPDPMELFYEDVTVNSEPRSPCPKSVKSKEHSDGEINA
ncbi:unnamed protein product [Thelazia callipaeda]|uniref:BACK domain-containing protein n=1 Tax=Thelazia callipaeda TaxID=103827 RepID=A0A0N5D281_THECL|nr:unnamed protein product [Thelazia callipaeda]